MTSPATADAGFNPTPSATVRGGDCRGYPICPLGAGRSVSRLLAARAATNSGIHLLVDLALNFTPPALRVDRSLVK
jgi:hypothetical protein